MLFLPDSENSTRQAQSARKSPGIAASHEQVQAPSECNRAQV